MPACSEAQRRCPPICRGTSGAQTSPRPRSRSGTLSVQRQLGPSWVVTTAYVGSSSRHLQRLYNMNAAGPGDSRTERERRMIPSLGAITMTDSLGSASYHGLQATMDKRLSHGWQGSLVLHLEPLDRRRDGTRRGRREHGDPGLAQPSAAIEGIQGSTGGIGWSRTEPSISRSVPVAAGCRAEVLWASCSATGSCRRSSRRSPGPTSTSRCSTPRTASASRSAAACGGPIWWVIQPWPHPTADAWLNPAAFAIPQNADGTYRYGNLGRNTLLGPGYFNLDAALTKDIRLGDTRRLQIRWEVFNLTNHPSFGLPNAELGSADFGTIRSTVSTPRQMQFGVKFLF